MKRTIIVILLIIASSSLPREIGRQRPYISRGETAGTPRVRIRSQKSEIRSQNLSSVLCPLSSVRQPTETKNTYAMIIGGINKDPKERLAKDKVVLNLRRFFLNNAKLKPARLSVLVADNSSLGKGLNISNAENLKKTIKTLAAAVQPEDRFIFYYVGQANIVAGKLRLNLPGEDITHEQLAEWINRIRASSMLLVLDCPGAGLAVKAMTGQGRIIIGACTAEQHYSTRFSEYFVPSLVDSKSDTDSDGKVSLLEAFTFASKKLDDWYFRQLLLKTETPVLEDNADGLPSRQPWRYKQDKTDGREASKFFLSAG